MNILPGVVENTPQGAGRGHPKHLGEYIQLPWGVCSTTLGSMFTTWGVCYPWEYVQLPWGVCSTTLGSMFDYPGIMFNYLFSTHGDPELFQTLTEHSHSTSRAPQSPLWARLGPETEIDDFRAGPRPDFDDPPSQNQRFGTRHRIPRIPRNQRSEVQPEPAFYTRRGSG